jgi:hypothetical protein
LGAIGIGISEVIYQNTGGNGHSRQTEYHPFSRKELVFWMPVLPCDQMAVSFFSRCSRRIPYPKVFYPGINSP